MKHKIKIPYKVTEAIQADLENNLSYLSDMFKSYSVSLRDGIVEYDLNTEANAADAEKYIIVLIEKIKPNYETEEITIFDKTKYTPRNSAPIFQSLIDQKIVFEHMPGIFSFHDLFHDMYMALEKQVMDHANKEKARRVILPITTSVQTLQESNFFNRTPQFANFVSLLKSDGHSISEASKELSKSKTPNIQNYLNNPTQMCRSAGCLSSYPLFRNSVLSPDDYTTLTMRGKVFRNESTNVTTLERLHEFTMRELIFFGDSDYVVKGLESSLDWYKDFLERFELKGKIQVASDPFFADNLKVLKFYQMAQQSKLEICLFNSESGRYVAVGSINNHGSHYSKSFNIKLNEKDHATTGCVGFGYERLVYLFLCQYGLDTKSWSQEAKEFWGI